MLPLNPALFNSVMQQHPETPKAPSSVNANDDWETMHIPYESYEGRQDRIKAGRKWPGNLPGEGYEARAARIRAAGGTDEDIKKWGPSLRGR